MPTLGRLTVASCSSLYPLISVFVSHSSLSAFLSSYSGFCIIHVVSSCQFLRRQYRILASFPCILTFLLFVQLLIYLVLDPSLCSVLTVASWEHSLLTQVDMCSFSCRLISLLFHSFMLHIFFVIVTLHYYNVIVWIFFHCEVQ